MKMRFKVAIAIIIIVSIFIKIKWVRWFNNPEEAHFTTEVTPSRVMLCMGEQEGSYTVTWISGSEVKEGQLQMIYSDLDLNSNSEEISDSILSVSDINRVDANYRYIESRGGDNSFFSVKLDSIDRDRSFIYRVGSDKFGYSKWSRVGGVDLVSDSIRFIYFGDIQDSIGGNSKELIGGTIRATPDLDFITFGGDMIERPTDAYWKQWYDSGDGYFAKYPIFATPGNHEHYKGVTKVLGERWTGHFDFPSNGPSGFIKSSFYLDYKGCRFISINSDAIVTPMDLLGHRSWLEEVLKGSEKKWNIVVLHHPIYSVAVRHNYALFREAFKPIFDEYGVDLVLSGHNHGYGRFGYIKSSCNPDRQGPVYVVSTSSYRSYQVRLDSIIDRLAVNVPMYQLFDVTDRSLKMQTFTDSGVYYDGFELIKDDDGFNKFIDLEPDTPEMLSPSPRFLRNSSVEEQEQFIRDIAIRRERNRRQNRR